MLEASLLCNWCLELWWNEQQCQFVWWNSNAEDVRGPLISNLFGEMNAINANLHLSFGVLYVIPLEIHLCLQCYIHPSIHPSIWMVLFDETLMQRILQTPCYLIDVWSFGQYWWNEHCQCKFTFIPNWFDSNAEDVKGALLTVILSYWCLQSPWKSNSMRNTIYKHILVSWR